MYYRTAVAAVCDRHTDSVCSSPYAGSTLMSANSPSKIQNSKFCFSGLKNLNLIKPFKAYLRLFKPIKAPGGVPYALTSCREKTFFAKRTQFENAKTIAIKSEIKKKRDILSLQTNPIFTVSKHTWRIFHSRQSYIVYPKFIQVPFFQCPMQRICLKNESF